MPRHFKSPSRTISNKGEYPRFVGLLSSPKATNPSPWYVEEGWGVVPFDSLSALICAIHLEWRRNVESFSFEKRAFSFSATDQLPKLRCIPDFEVVLTTAEIGLVEAKYSESELRPQERLKLELASRHAGEQGLFHEVIFRRTLEVNGFADTIFLLRPYGLMEYPEAKLDTAFQRLSSFEVTDLATWRERAIDARVPIAVLYKLLYQQRLPLKYRHLQFIEMDKWHA